MFSHFISLSGLFVLYEAANPYFSILVAHSDDERIDIADLQAAVKGYKKLIKHILYPRRYSKKNIPTLAEKESEIIQEERISMGKLEVTDDETESSVTTANEVIPPTMAVDEAEKVSTLAVVEEVGKIEIKTTNNIEGKKIRRDQSGVD